MEFTAAQVWGLAVRADVLNEGYCKEAVYDNTPNEIGYSKKIKEANKILVKHWLRDNIYPSLQEVAAGQKCRNHFNSYIFDMIAGQLSSFQQTAMKVASKEIFTINDMMDVSVVSCLPQQVRRDEDDLIVKAAISNSQPLIGKKKDAVTGDITILRCRYSDFCNKYKIQAQLGDSIVDFWFLKKLDGTLKIKGKIKEHRSNNTTALHYVKIVS
jgi:hypothetical protein